MFLTFHDKINANQMKTKIYFLNKENVGLRNQLIEKKVTIHKVRNSNKLDISAYTEKKIQTQTTKSSFNKNFLEENKIGNKIRIHARSTARK